MWISGNENVCVWKSIIDKMKGDYSYEIVIDKDGYYICLLKVRL